MGRHRLRIVCFGVLAIALAACSSSPSRGPILPSRGHAAYKIGSPYEVDGTWYYPAENWTYDKTGIASWYGESFDGKYTADGEVFDLNALTAAHKTLPLPSIVRVTDLENGRSIVVRINDRGPFVRGRIIDLSRRAAQLLGFEQEGTAKVRVRIMPVQSFEAATGAGRRGPMPAVVAAALNAEPERFAAARVQAAPDIVVASRQSATLPPPQVSSSPTPQPLVADSLPLPPETVSVVPVKPSAIYIQAGAFASIENAMRLKDRLENLGSVEVTDVDISGTTLYRVRVGPVPSVDQADALLSRVIATSPDAQIVVN